MIPPRIHRSAIRQALSACLVVIAAAAAAARYAAAAGPPGPPREDAGQGESAPHHDSVRRHDSVRPHESIRHHESVRHLIGEAFLSEWGYERLRELCDTIGARPAGSPAMHRAVAWSESTMRAAGLEAVHREAATVPGWTRGPESLQLVSPMDRPLTMMSLGQSTNTAPGGLTADVVVVASFEELARLGRTRVAGRIVLFDYAWTSYSAASEFRTNGASMAAALGAVAMLCRSATGNSLDTPHVGRLVYAPGSPAIPAAAVSVEAAALLRRLVEAGHDVRVHLDMRHHVGDSTECHNVMGEIRGRELPEEIVLLAGHLDSWDAGQGAQDDGVGCLLMLEAARLIRSLPEPPRRTIRVVFFTDEETSGGGSTSYLKFHGTEFDRHVAGFESDYGNGLATGFAVDVQGVAGPTDSLRTDATARRLRREVLAALESFRWALAPLGADRSLPGGAGVDIDVAVKRGMLGLGVRHAVNDYFDIHHSPGDTFDRVDKRDFAQNAAIIAVAVHLLANAPDRLLPAVPRADETGTR